MENVDQVSSIFPLDDIYIRSALHKHTDLM